MHEMVSWIIYCCVVFETKLRAKNAEIALVLRLADGQVYALEDEVLGLKEQVDGLKTELEDSHKKVHSSRLQTISLEEVQFKSQV